ncbi:nucleotidyl transferase AbiEii/AbiGii toxin family protein [Cellulomonas sp. URHD0024]|uniref:nucleotidyl transferase AbiEii/AbiGii toxin family protein n=1 Tax=Cellulomonas sp. URHD0024 TaxID=1302620 RepID=UPI000415DE6C|nr:nucleotidyl transferase AbiEii/AbiGii toxin family protein [Cellulomonas sp. URHD0024]
MSTIDLSSSTDSRIAVAGQVLAMLQETAGSHSVPLMVIGATARDILSVAIAGTPPARATADVDIAVAVPSWQAFEALTSDLERVGRRRHTFLVSGTHVDVVPFGDLETSGRVIDWGDGSAMNTLGLREAHAASLPALLPGGTTVRVPSVAGLVTLKLIAWSDRRLETRRDAVDLQTIIGWTTTGALLDDLYATGVALLEAYEFDPDLAAAHRLGHEMFELLGSAAPQVLALVDDDNLARLAADMPTSVVDPAPALRALRTGLSGRPTPDITS